MEVDGSAIPVVLTRGLTLGFQLAAMEAVPDVLLEDFPFARICSDIGAEELDPLLVAAWKELLRREPAPPWGDKELTRAFLARHRAEVAGIRQRLAGD